MTAGKVMSAIKVDLMCRRQQAAPMLPAAAASSALVPTVLDVMRGAAAQRRRGDARVCLFGAPEPGSTRVLYDRMLEQQRRHMLDRYAFDVTTDRCVGDEATDGGEAALQTSAAVTADVPIVDQLQQRLQAEEIAVAASSQSSTSSSSSIASEIDDSVGDETPAAAVGASKAKPTKSTASLRHTKPYDKPAVRPITGKHTIGKHNINTNTSKQLRHGAQFYS